MPVEPPVTIATFPSTLVEPGMSRGVWGNPGAATTFDAFGNLENSPPVTVDGVDYPFGRIYYGRSQGGVGMQLAMADFLSSQSVQEPFELDTTWLCVGHVDEFATVWRDLSAGPAVRQVGERSSASGPACERRRLWCDLRARKGSTSTRPARVRVAERLDGYG